MFSAATYTNVSSDTVNLKATGYALKTLEESYEYEGSEFAKQNDSGQNAAQSFVRRLVVTVTVQIIGTGATQALGQADYWTKRNAFIKAFLVVKGAQTNYNHGTLAVTPQGGASMYVDANVTGLQLPLAYDEAGAFVSTASVTLRADYGYWRATAGGAVVYF